MSLASDEKAFTKAIGIEENKNLFNKVKEAIKNIVARIKEWFKKVDENGVVSGHNMQAQPWLGDVQALEQLAQKFNELTIAAKQNKAEFGERESEERYSIDEKFYSVFGAWDGVNPSQSFSIGNTSEALQSVGVKKQSIIKRSGMIISKINKHTEMTRKLFRQIPELLEKPVIIQFSDAIDPLSGKQKYDSRITVLGELQATLNGKSVPVLVSLELMPTNQKKTSLLDVSVITSAYGHSKINQYLNDNSILYIDPDKKRTNKWLSLNGLQLPVGETKSGPIRKISYSNGKVKIQNPIHMTQMQEKLYRVGIIDEYGNPIDKSGKKSKDDAFYFDDEGDLFFGEESGALDEVNPDDAFDGSITLNYGYISKNEKTA